MNAPNENQEKKERVPGPKTVENVQDRLQNLAAFAFLGKGLYGRRFIRGRLGRIS